MINPKATIEVLNNSSAGNMVGHLGIEYTELGENYIIGRMPVDERTVQPLNMLHGGASVVLAETLASVGGNLCVDNKTQFVAGLEINANHIKGVRKGNGFVTGKASIVHLGKKTQVWTIEIKNDQGDLVCVSRITLAVINKK